MKAAIFTVEGKGGVGKSTCAGLAVEAVGQDCKRSVISVYVDTTNSTMASMYNHVEMIDTSEEEAAGRIAAVLSTSSDFMVMDMGARSESTFVNKILPRLWRNRKRLDVEIVVLRPITTSGFVQANAVSFVMNATNFGVKTVLVRNASQGRTADHFSDWDKSPGRKVALELGAREMVLSDAGVRWGDEVPAYGLTFSAAAKGDFSRVEPKYLPSVERLFTPGVQAHLGFWVEENAERLLKVLRELGIKL